MLIGGVRVQQRGIPQLLPSSSPRSGSCRVSYTLSEREELQAQTL